MVADAKSFILVLQVSESRSGIAPAQGCSVSGSTKESRIDVALPDRRLYYAELSLHLPNEVVVALAQRDAEVGSQLDIPLEQGFKS
jgi:hypothetical protein